MSLSPFIEIDDGYTLDSDVPAMARLYAAIPFRYRPALPAEVVAFSRGQNRGAPEQEVTHQCQFILDHLVSWDVTNKRGELVRPSLEMLAKMYPNILASFVNHICGWQSPAREADAKN